MKDLETLATTIRAKFAPKKVATQQEYDSWMEDVNHDQAAYNRPLNKTKEDILRKICELKIQRLSVDRKLAEASLDYSDNESLMRFANGIYHELKHEMAMLNSKQELTVEDRIS